MKRFKSLPLVAVALVLALASCKNKVPEQVNYIPKDAILVLDLNWKSLSEKTKSGNINWDSLVSSIAGPTEDSAVSEGLKKMEAFMESGIDDEGNVFVFVKTGGSIMSGQSTSAGVVAAMKDDKKFEDYVKKQAAGSEVKKEKDYSYINLDDEVVVGWNDKVAILAGVERNYNDTATSGASLQQLSKLFSLKEEESVGAIPEFAEMVTQEGDILLWNNSSGLLNSLPLLGMTKFADLLKDSYSTAVINFDNGKITASAKSYSGKDLAEIWKKYAGPTADMSMVSQYPYPVQGFAAFSFNPQLIKEIIKYSGFESTTNDFLQKQGYTLDDVLKVFKGDFAVIFSDIGVTEKTIMIGEEAIVTKQPTARLIFNATIGDKATYDKIAAKLAEQGMMEERNGQFVPTGMGEFAFSVTDKNLVLASDSALLQQYLAGKGNAAIPAAIADNAKNRSTVFYIDINNILKSVPVDSTGLATMESAKSTFKNMAVTSDNFNGKYVAGNLELATMNASENSLVSLIRFFAAAANDIAAQQRMYSSGGMMDRDEFDSEEFMVEPPAQDKAQ